MATIVLEARPWFVSVSDEAAWILPLGEGEGRSNGLFRIDPATNSVTDFVEIPGAPSIFAPVIGRDSVWVPIVESNGDAFILRIASQTNTVVGTGMPVPSSLAVGIWQDDILLLGERGVLYDFSTESSETQEVVSDLSWPAKDSVAPSAELDLSNSVWIANFENTVTRVDLAQE